MRLPGSPCVNYHLEGLEGEGPYRVLMIAAPVFDAEGRTLLAISLFDLPAPLSATKVAEWGARLRDVGSGTHAGDSRGTSRHSDIGICVHSA